MFHTRTDPLINTEALAGFSQAKPLVLMRSYWNPGEIIRVDAISSQHELSMFAESDPKATGHFILERLQFTINFHLSRLWLRGLACVNFHKLIGDLVDLYLFSLLQAPAPKRLQRRSVSRAFGDLQRNNLRVENICHDLPPDFGFGAAAGHANLRRFHAEIDQPTQPVLHAQRYA